MRRCQRPSGRCQRAPRVYRGCRVRCVRRCVWRVPSRGRGEGLNGPVVTQSGRPFLLQLRLLLILASSGAHVASRRLMTSYVREGWLLEYVMMKMMLRRARYATRRQQSATGSG